MEVPRAFGDVSLTKISLSAGGAVPVDGPSTGLALQRLGDRAHLLSSLVAQLRQKVWLPSDARLCRSSD